MFMPAAAASGGAQLTSESTTCSQAVLKCKPQVSIRSFIYHALNQSYEAKHPMIFEVSQKQRVIVSSDANSTGP
ncbi:unnamed protein product [Enterobius vermicularis]|uniref:Secreted protein n=1 Tax=Enterobius vermicularis TaxID=51028 RepID=A0A0N4VLE8_ENTVE|nr:unnamed protein product [Enterobius vermicularis]